MNPIRVINLGALGQRQEGAPLPAPDGALYRRPNPDGSRKSCRLCIMWVSEENKCVIHPKDVEVTADMVCGFHVYGEPIKKWMDHPGIQPVTPDLSGLQIVGAGAVCASCRFYEDGGNGAGLCWGVSKPEDRRPPQPVELMGWCSRYEGM